MSRKPAKPCTSTRAGCDRPARRAPRWRSFGPVMITSFGTERSGTRPLHIIGCSRQEIPSHRPWRRWGGPWAAPTSAEIARGHPQKRFEREGSQRRAEAPGPRDMVRNPMDTSDPQADAFLYDETISGLRSDGPFHGVPAAGSVHGIVDEHHAVRKAVGFFDVSAMASLRCGASASLPSTVCHQRDPRPPGRAVALHGVLQRGRHRPDDPIIYRLGDAGAHRPQTPPNREKIVATSTPITDAEVKDIRRHGAHRCRARAARWSPGSAGVDARVAGDAGLPLHRTRAVLNVLCNRRGRGTTGGTGWRSSPDRRGRACGGLLLRRRVPGRSLRPGARTPLRAWSARWPSTATTSTRPLTPPEAGPDGEARQGRLRRGDAVAAKAKGLARRLWASRSGRQADARDHWDVVDGDGRRSATSPSGSPLAHAR